MLRSFISLMLMIAVTSVFVPAAKADSYSLPTPGRQIIPQKQKPVLGAKPTLSTSVGHKPAPLEYFYTVTTKQKAFRQGTVNLSDAKWLCKGSRCTAKAAWKYPPFKSCEELSHAVGALRSFSRPGVVMSAGHLKQCNAGVQGIKTTAQGLAPVAALATPRSPQTSPKPPEHKAVGASASTSPAPQATPGAGSFTLSGTSPAARQVQRHNALSTQQLRGIGTNSQNFKNFQRRFAESMAAAEERIRALSEEAYHSGADCDDRDAEILPGRPETCDHKDNDCDGEIDEGVGTYKFADVDGDTHGDPATMMKVCSSDIERALGTGHWLVDVGNDCNDQDPGHWNDCPPATAGH